MKSSHIIFLIAAMAVLSLLSAFAPEVGGTILVTTVLGATGIFLSRRWGGEDNSLLVQIFLIGLVVRLLFGLLVHVYDLREFFGGDANTYDANGNALAEYWAGLRNAFDPEVVRASATSGPSWGMFYLTGGIYSIFGRQILVAQTVCAGLGALTIPAVYFCANKVFQNRNVSRIAAFSTAFFPAFIIWSSQLLKDGIIVFLLVVSMIAVIQLQQKFNYTALLVLLLSLGGIITLRFYIFYMLAMAVGGSFVIGVNNSLASIGRRTVILVLMGLGLTYLGVIRNASIDFERYGSLENIQRSRSDLARSESGFGEDLDVSTTEGAITAVPVGFAYLMFAPFPWEVTNFRQAITLPEVLVWWAMMPFLAAGIWYAVKYKLRTAFPILLFSLLLTIAYSIFQGNVGTAYRQRMQIQVFLFIFIAVGWTMYKERRDDRKALAARRRPMPMAG